MTALTRLTLQDFRNHAALSLRLDGRHVCLYGPNGAGKTNLLEALSQFGPGRGLRGAGLSEMARHEGPGGWSVSVERDGGRLGVGLEAHTGPAGPGPARRIIRIDGAPASAGDLAERVRLVWLTPAMDGVFRGAASDRRRFFDRLVMAHVPAHGPASAAYEKAMRERNALLERGAIDPAWADALEARLAEAGAACALNRARVLARLKAQIDARPEGAFPKADLALEGPSEVAAYQGASLADLASDLREALRQGRRRDAAAGRTQTGPHRSDLLVVHRPTGAPAAAASTGQQKALLIGLVVASAEALKTGDTGPTPLLLLDEAAAHLDSDRRAALFDELSALGGQSWLTGTEAFLFEAFGNRAERVEVKDGTARLV